MPCRDVRERYGGGVPLLWTGGWDSTYRLLELLLVYRQVVQPYYLIDPARPSTGRELLAMARLKQGIRGRASERDGKLLPTIVLDLADLPRPAARAGQLAVLRERGPLGGQYEWLAAFADYLGVATLELALHRGDRAAAFVEPFCESVESDRGTLYQLMPDSRCAPGIELFGSFVFPLLMTTKSEMRERAQQHGFEDVLDRTWFCHAPLFGSVPCGACNPCADAVKMGMAPRIGWIGRLHGAARRTYRLGAAAFRRVLGGT